MGARWLALDDVLATLAAAPSRTGSVIATVYGDAILPRGGALALADLLVLMHRLGASDGVVRTAVSRLAKDGVLVGCRAGRRSAYALTQSGQAEFRSAVPRIYGGAEKPWDGRLRLAFPDPGADRASLDQAGFAVLAPGVLVSPWAAPEGVAWLDADGRGATARQLATRAWNLARLGTLHRQFSEVFSQLLPSPAVSPLDAMAARTMVIHAWRRIALRDPLLPTGLLPPDWPGTQARQVCVATYRGLSRQSEAWLDNASSGSGPLPAGPDPTERFGPHDPLPPAGEGA